MKPRTCIVRVWISNDKGERCCYSLKPLSPSQLAPAQIAGFQLVNLTRPERPVYTLSLHQSGFAGCNCPQNAGFNGCKHADALLAAGILPSALIAALQQRTQLLDAAEAECRRLGEAGAEEKTIHELNAQGAAERIADLEEELQRHDGSVANLLVSLSNRTERCALLQQQLDEAQDMIQQLEQRRRRRPAKRQAA